MSRVNSRSSGTNDCSSGVLPTSAVASKNALPVAARSADLHGDVDALKMHSALAVADDGLAGYFMGHADSIIIRTSVRQAWSHFPPTYTSGPADRTILEWHHDTGCADPARRGPSDDLPWRMSGPEKRPFPEIRNFGRPEVEWPARPDSHTVPEVAAHLVRHRVARELRERQISARRLEEQIGDSERTWNARLTGARNLGLEDLIALSMLIPNLLNRVLGSSSDVDDWLPASYADMTEGAIGGPVFPRFRLAGEVGWDSAAYQVGDWWSRAIGRDRPMVDHLSGPDARGLAVPGRCGSPSGRCPAVSTG